MGTRRVDFKQSMNVRKLGKWTLAAVLVTGAVCATVWRAEAAACIEGLREWVREAGIWGPVAIAAVYVLSALFFVPGSLLTLAAGSVLEMGPALVCVSLGSTLGACAAFWAGRTLLRDWAEGLLGKSARFQALAEGMADEGLKLVLLTRLSPIFPFNALNYAFGVTRVRFRDYAIGSWLGMMPGTLLYVYLGRVLGEAATAGGAREKSPWEWAALALGLAATAAISVVMTKIARRAIARAEAERGDTESRSEKDTTPGGSQAK